MKNIRDITTYEAGVVQAHAHRQLQKYCDEALVQFGITKMQWLVVGTIFEAGTNGIRISDLAQKLGTTLPYLTNTVNLLESKHIVTRKDHGDDSRAKLVTVNKSFRPKCAEIEQTLRKALRQTIYADIDPKDFETYIRVLYKLADIEK